MAACQLFGCTRSLLLGRNINLLIPDLIARHHKKVLTLANEKPYEHFTRKCELFTYGKSIAGYIFPLKLQVRKILSFSVEGDQYGALLHPVQTAIKESELNLLLDKKFRIVGVSEECVRILGLTKKIIERQKIPVTVVIPDFPSDEKLMRAIEEGGDERKLSFEEKADVCVPTIVQTDNSNNSSKLEMGNSEEDDSIFSEMRVNFGFVNDSFLNNSNSQAQFDTEEENDDQPYTITASERKLHCKITVTTIYATKLVGYAVRVVDLERRYEECCVIKSARAGKFQMLFSTKFNAFVRVPTDSAKKFLAESNVKFVKNIGLFCRTKQKG